MKNNQKILNKYLAVLSSTLILASTSISVSAHPKSKFNIPKVPEVNMSDSRLDSELGAVFKTRIPSVDMSDSVLYAEFEKLCDELDTAAERAEAEALMKELAKAPDNDIHFDAKYFHSKNDIKLKPNQNIYQASNGKTWTITNPNSKPHDIKNPKLKPNQSTYQASNGKTWIITDPKKK